MRVYPKVKRIGVDDQRRMSTAARLPVPPAKVKVCLLQTLATKCSTVATIYSSDTQVQSCGGQNVPR